MAKRSSIFLLLTILVSLFLFTAAFADEGDGNGGGTKDNSDIALTLESSSVINGSIGVPLNPTIQLNFNKNICNITTLPNNKMCFHLTDENGNAVPIKLIFPDSQVQHKYRHEVFIIPRENLEANSTYRISVDNTLEAKNGTVIDNAHNITFTTGTDTTDEKNVTLENLGDYTVTYETSFSETENSVPVNKELLEGDGDDNGLSTSTISKIAIAVIVLLLIIFTCVILIRRRNKRTS